MIKKLLPTAEPPKRGELARMKLLNAALKLFGDYGLDGASVRKIAKEAGQNLGAITYYFGDKEGLYSAVVEMITDDFRQKMASHHQEINEKLNQGPLSQDEYLLYVKRMLAAAVMMFIRRDAHSISISKLLSREQFAPTHALRIFYDKMHAPMHQLLARLVGGYLNEDPESNEVVVRCYALMGSAMVFRMAHEMVLLRTGWKKIGDEEIALIAEIVSAHAELVLKGLHDKKM